MTATQEPLDDLDPAAMAEAVAALTEDELRDLLVGEARTAVVDEIFRRFPEFLDDDAVAGVDAAIGWRITGDGEEDHFGVVLRDGRCEAGRGLAADPDVTLELDTVTLVRLVTANADPAALVLGGALRIDGDGRRALQLASWFRVPSAGDGAGEHLDVTAVDENAIARIIGEMSDRELRDRLRGGVRDLILEEVFRRFADHLRTDRTGDLQATIAWRITGREDGGVDRWSTTIDRGSARVERDGDAPARVTIRLDAVQFLKLATGNGNPVMDFMRGRIKLKGDVGLAAKLSSLFEIPSG